MNGFNPLKFEVLNMAVGLVCCLVLFCLNFAESVNNAGIIGILTSPCELKQYNINVCKQLGYNNASFNIEGQYVQWIEGGGGRVIPILGNVSMDELNIILPQINGVLITGGASDLTPNSYFMKIINHILNYSQNYHLKYKKYNLNYSFPIWGTCLGFESIIAAVSIKKNEILTDFNATNVSLPLLFTNDSINSNMFGIEAIDNINTNYNRGNMPISYVNLIRGYYANYSVAFNDHTFGVSPFNFINDNYLNTNFTILSVSYDLNNRSFVSAIETKAELGYLWYATQFHPEKSQYVMDSTNDISNHKLKGIISNQYLASFFVNQCKISNNNTMDPNFYENNIIYRFQAVPAFNVSAYDEFLYLF